MDIEWDSAKVMISALKEYDKNPRRISKADFERLVNDLKQDGYHRRILVNQDNTIIGGHSRKKALLAAGFKNTDEIEVLKAKELLVESDLKRLNIRDNLPFGEFDFDMLANHFDPLELIEWGMPEEWLPEQVPEVLEGDDDVEAIDTNKAAITVLGDVWLLGTHRLMCGDSTNATQVQALINNAVPNLMITDPPYGVKYDAEWREGSDLGVGKRSKGKVLNDDRVDWTEAYSLFEGDVVYIWHAGKYTHLIVQHLEACGYDIISQIIWAKQHFALSRGDYHWQHEPCWYAVKKGAKHNWQGARDQATLWHIKNNNSFGNAEKEETWGHSTQKPIECMLRPILNNSAAGEWVYDPFGGSGTTLMACEKAKRNCYMMELSPHYCDVIVARWEKLTGHKAELERTK